MLPTYITEIVMPDPHHFCHFTLNANCVKELCTKKFSFFAGYVEQKYTKLAHITVKHVHIKREFVQCVAKKYWTPRIIDKVRHRLKVYWVDLSYYKITYFHGH